MDTKPENSGKYTVDSVCFTAESLGNKEFKKDYGIKYAYLLGAMYKGVASKELVVRAAKGGMLGFFGSGGLNILEIENTIKYIQAELEGQGAYGINFLHNSNNPDAERELADILIKYKVKVIEASAFINITKPLVRFRLKGLKIDSSSLVLPENKIIAKVSRPEIAEKFLAPPPTKIVQELLEEGSITQEEAQLSKQIPMAEDVCVESDSGGHTDGGVALVLMPAMLKLRDRAMQKYNYRKRIRIGAAGGVGTPEAAASAFMLGADFILTGSINQCSVEAATSNAVKEMLQSMKVQDTDYAPAGDMFELGAKVQVLKKGLFFSARANNLYELYKRYDSLDQIDENTRRQLEERYFMRSLDDVYKEVIKYYSSDEIKRAEDNPKRKMALVFRWYFGNATMLALNGIPEGRVNYQIHCGPALGAFNQWVKDTELESWENRHVDEMGRKLMEETSAYLNTRIRELISI